MKIRGWIVFALLQISLSGLAQSDTIKLVKKKVQIYQCIDENAKSWFLRESEGVYYLASLKIPKEEVESWFQRFSDSQNLYRSVIYLENGLSFLTFSKPNDAFDRIYFQIAKTSKQELQLITMGTEERYSFVLVEF